MRQLSGRLLRADGLKPCGGILVSMARPCAARAALQGHSNPPLECALPLYSDQKKLRSAD